MRSSSLIPGLGSAELQALKRRVRSLAEQRPGIYRMLDAAGRVLYVGKAKRLRSRLLSYFQADFPGDKGARILHAASDLSWDYAPSEFAAHLAELREIRRFRPAYNVQMNRRRIAVFVAVSDHAAPKLSCTNAPGKAGTRYYGPLASRVRTAAAVKVLSDLFGLRDCADRMPIVFAEQGDLFAAPRQAACSRYDLGLCSGPCAGLVSALEYRQRVESAAAFLEGRAIAPVDRVISGMLGASERAEFEAAARWRERFETLEWMLGATTRARAARQVLTFVYRDPGSHGDDRAYLIRRGQVRASYPWPATPIEQEAFRAVVSDELMRPELPEGPLQVESIEEMLLVMSWFRRHPEALRRTTKLEEWLH